ncbi:NADH-quinone oxidoreductase subunit N [Flavobacterium sp.]|uniref:NADH-quinone oxidoreductase subunit N n=1 Tax=Flavobacterium sp. TaxID=239 RepID=UPI002614882A|nr:NADH-quinone oxidoreductase subunit N [Flavobacterium sp.]
MNLLIAITGLGILCLLFEILNLRKALVPLVILGLLGCLAIDVYEFGTVVSSNNNMIAVNNFSAAFSALFIILTIFLVALSHNFYENHQSKISDYIAIKVFMLAGCVALVSFQNLAMFFLGIEVLSISLYILAASNRLNIKSNEAGMKYFLMGSFASAILLFGICLIYGAIGTFNVYDAGTDVPSLQLASGSAAVEEWLPIGTILLSIGLLFKIAAVPFHFWAPDVYQGSPALTTATMSTIGKVAAMAAFFKLAVVMNVNLPAAQSVIVVVSILSMSVGNIMALRQSNVKRMLAFSGVSHAGFMLMTLLGTENPSGTLFYYSAAYALAGIAAFSVILYVCKNRDNEDITNFNGLGKTNPLLAAVLTGALLSMAGIPIFAGFFAKLILFGQVISAGYIALVIVAVVNSIISVGYYFKLILAMYTKEPNEERTGTPILIYATAVISISLNIAMGLFPSVIIDLLS